MKGKNLCKKKHDKQETNSKDEKVTRIKFEEKPVKVLYIRHAKHIT